MDKFIGSALCGIGGRIALCVGLAMGLAAPVQRPEDRLELARLGYSTRCAEAPKTWAVPRLIVRGHWLHSM